MKNYSKVENISVWSTKNPWGRGAKAGQHVALTFLLAADVGLILFFPQTGHSADRNTFFLKFFVNSISSN